MTLPVRHAHSSTYFVGRRARESAEVYAVTPTDVERLGSPGPQAGALDWHGTGAARMELSCRMIAGVTGRIPRRPLQLRFALCVLEPLPHRGFVLDSDDVWQWLTLASQAGDFAPDHASRSSWKGRLRSRLSRSLPETSDV